MAVPLFDAHCDTATCPHSLRCGGGQLDLERLGRYAPAAQIFAVWGDPLTRDAPWFHEALSRLLDALRDNADLALLCRSAAEAKSAAREKKLAAFVSAEGAGLLDCSVAELRRAYERGLRVVTLTWNSDNALAGAAMGNGGGWTFEGRAFVRAAMELGVAVDVSHASEQTFWDTLKVATHPVFASHSSARALCDHPRNLTDAQFSALAASGGCVGVNLYPDFLGLGRDLDAIVAHLEHFLALGGETCTCLGCDFDGVDCLPRGITGVESLDTLYEALLRRSYPESLVRDIFYNNLLSFMERAL